MDKRNIPFQNNKNNSNRRNYNSRDTNNNNRQGNANNEPQQNRSFNNRQGNANNESQQNRPNYWKTGKNFNNNDQNNSLEPKTSKTNSTLEFDETELNKIEAVRNIVLRPYTENYQIAAKLNETCTLGKPIKLTTNHYNIKIEKEFTAYHYDLSFFEQKDNYESFANKEDKVYKPVAVEFFKKFSEANPQFQNKLFYDFRKNLYFLIEPNINEFRFEIESGAEKKHFKVELKRVGEISFDKDSNLNSNILRILQMIFTFNFKINTEYISLNSHRFFKADCEKNSLGLPSSNLNAWKGFFVSLRPTKNGLTLNLNLFHSAFSKETNLIDLACFYFSERNYVCNPQDLNRHFNQRNNRFKTKEKFLELLQYFKISPIYLEYKKKKKAQGLEKSALQCKLKETPNVDLVQYFKTKYNRDIDYPDLPCVKFGEENYIPLELCVTAVENKAHLDKQTQSNFIRQTAIDSKERFSQLEQLRNSLKLESNPNLNEIKMIVDKRMIDLDARHLDAIDIEYGNSEFVTIDKGRWDNQNKKFFKPKNISESWVAYSFCPESKLNKTSFDEFIDKLITQAKKHGIEMPKPSNNEKLIDLDEIEAFEFFEKEINLLKPNFILIILPGKNLIYNALKTAGDLIYGIQTQAIDIKTVHKTQKQGASPLNSNISLKINAKLGGVNFVINKEHQLYKKYLKKYFEGHVMIFGCDVNKPSPIDKSNKKNGSNTTDMTNSMGAVTGSIDQNWSYYAARMVAQIKHKKDSLEYINDLKYPVKELLEEYQKANEQFPSKLIFYRDGISEGEFKNILNHEMNEIRAACSDISTGYKPAVTFIVVQKRHQTRFYADRNSFEIGETTNIPPGTLVDTKVVTPDMIDYYLNSHLCIQGTTKPCHYYILHDENNFDINAIKLLSHYLCHIYERSTTAVSYPAPTYYADHCAERARVYLADRIAKNYYEKSSALVDSYPIEVHENFKNKMFFI